MPHREGKKKKTKQFILSAESYSIADVGPVLVTQDVISYIHSIGSM